MVGVNPEILENKERRNFWTITVMYIQVYIFEMEMSQRIHFWYQISLKISIFWQNGKKNPTFLVNFFFVPATKVNFELKTLKFGRNHVKTKL